MSRILKTLLLVSLVVGWCGSTFGAAVPKYRMRGKIIDVDARDFQSPQSTAAVPQTWGRSVPVATASAYAQQMGATYYDYQHNGSVGRQVDKFGNNVNAAWMAANGPSISVRFANWNQCAINGGIGPVVLPNGGSINALSLGPPLTPAGTAFAGAVRPGYVNTRNRPSGKAVVQYHDAPETGGGHFWELMPNLSLGSGIFANGGGTGFAQSPQPAGGAYAADGVIWPKGAISTGGTCGSNIVHHTVATWSGASNETWYWRGVMNDVTGAVVWDDAVFPNPRLIDSVSVGISNVIEAYQGEVSIVLGKQVNTTNADVVIYRSTNCGESWGTVNVPFDNITEYSSDDEEGFWVECNAVYDVGGELHVIWNNAPANGQDAPCNLYHWSPTTGARLITSAGWTNTCVNGTQRTSGSGNGSGTNNLAIAEPGLSVKPAGVYGADELIYAVWTQFGPTNNDCATVDAVGTLGGHVNGEIYMSVSTNDGLTWDRPQNLTGTVTPDCKPDSCLSEGWVTVAARADSGVYISYMEDTHAGPIVFGGGAWSLGAYRVAAPEARPAVLEPVIAVSPLDFIELRANPVTGLPETANLNIISVGNDDLDYTVTVTSENGGDAHVLVNGSPSTGGTILAGGAPQVVTISYECGGLGDPEEFHWRLEVTSTDPTNNPSQGGEPIDVTLEVFSASEWYTCVEDTLSTGPGGSSMQISSCLEMGDQGTDGLGFYEDWMFSGSAVVARDDGSQTYAWHNAFMGLADRTRDENKSFRALGPLNIVRDQVYVVGDSSYRADRAFGVASTTDTTIGIDYEIVFPRKVPVEGDLGDARKGCAFIFNMKSLTGSPLTGVHFGAVADLDADPDAGENAGRVSEAQGWVSAIGGSSDEDGNFTPNTNYIALFHLPVGSICTRNGAAAGQVLANPNYVHPENAFSVDSLYMLFELFGSAGSWGSNIHIDTGQQFDDVSVMLVSGYNQTLDNAAITKWGYGVAVSDLSEADLEANINAVRALVAASCQVACLIEIAGDVNVSGAITSADIISLVNFVFKGQTAPQPCEANGDVNCSGAVTSADIIYLVNHVFKGQAAPCDICNSETAMECVP